MSVVGPILDGLQEVHSKNLLHRDIKPENILIGPSGAPVLIDFGSAREANGMTTAMTSIVTHGYSPIEQYQMTGRMGPWTDIYALGAVMARAMTGRKPPVAADRLSNDSWVGLKARELPGFSQEFCDAVDRALRVHPEQRPESVAYWKSYFRLATSARAFTLGAGESRSKAEEARDYFYSIDGGTEGPFSFEEISKMVADAQLPPTILVAQAGSETWSGFLDMVAQRTVAKPAPSKANANLIENLAGKISQASGLEKLEGFSLKQLFSQVFRHHTAEEIEEHFSSGTIMTTPPLQSVNPNWPTPWAFVRLLGLSLIAAAVFYWAFERFGNPLLIPGWLFVGSFGIPFSVLVFFIESNVLRNVSFYRVLSLMFLGGLMSLIFSLFLFEYARFLSSWLGAMAAGIVEETGKLLAVVFFTRLWSRFGWTLNGLLFGAAVGTGFSAFETAGYIFRESNIEDALTVMSLRACLSPLTHTIWTAAAAAALWRVKQNQPFEWSMLKDVKFLRIFLIVVVLHTLWNSPLQIPVLGADLGFIGFRLLLGLIGWIVILLLMQSGLKEVRSARDRLVAETR
jgi:RsiW-degrading membrane proteinase PrsW (M82 family)